MIEFAIYSLRMVLLSSSLRLVGHSVLDPIFVSLCGIGQAFCNVFKSMKAKKNFYKLTIEDIEEQNKKKISDSEMKRREEMGIPPSPMKAKIINTLLVPEMKVTRRNRVLSDIMEYPPSPPIHNKS